MIKPNIQLFAEGEAATGESVQVAAEQAEAGTAAQQTAQKPDRAEEYKKFKADFKQEYDAEVQGIIKDRLKKANSEAQEAKNYRTKTERVFEALSAMYNIDAQDIDAIVEAVEKDDSYYRDAAYEKGLEVSEYKRIKQIESENKRLNFEHQQMQDEERKRQFFTRIENEVAIAQAAYPDFDITLEANNPGFQRMVESGVDCKTAYEIIHHEEIMEAIKRQAAAEVASKIQSDAVRNSSRPVENGVGSPNAVRSEMRISSLTKQQMEQLKERARRGERVDLKSNF